MRINWKVLAIAAVAAGTAATVPAGDLEAQGRSKQKAERRDDRRVSDRDRIYDRNQDRDWRRGVTRVNRTKQNGPPFCRSGAGHPVHGRSWCVAKGYGNGSDRWGRAGGWGDVILGRNDRDRNRNGSVGSGSIADILNRDGRAETVYLNLGR